MGQPFHRRALAMAIAAAIIATSPIYLTACGGGGGSGMVKSSTPTPPPSPPPPPPPPPPAPTFDIWAPASASAPGGDGTWSKTSSSWTDSDGDAPAAMSPQPGFAVFKGTPGNVTVDDGAGNINITGMQFMVDGYTLTGDALTLVGSNGNPVTIDVGDGGSGGAGYKATINNVLIGGAGLAKSGAGTLVLTGTNTYTGETDIKAGTLALVGNGGIADSKAVGVDIGGTLDISGTTSGGSIQSLSGSGAIKLGSQRLLLSNASGDFSGVISGSGVLTVSSGTEILSGANTYAGGTNINGGVLQVSSDANLGSVYGHVVINNGTLRVGASFTLEHTIAVGNVATIDTNGYAVTLDGISGAVVGVNSGLGTFVKKGAGILTFSTLAGPSWGATNIEAGTLAGYISLTGPVNVASGATLDVSSGGGVVSALGGDGTVALGSNLLQIVGGSIPWTFGGVVADGGIAGGSGGSVDFYGSNITATLTGANTYTGATTIENGTLALAGNGSIADSSVVVVGDAGNSGTLDISGTNNGATIKSLSGGVLGPGAVVLGGKTLTVSDAGNKFGGAEFGGVISGTGGLVLSGGTLTLSGANTYTGGTTIDAGATLNLGNYGDPTNGSIVGNAVDNGSLVFSHPSDMTFGGTISGTGSVTVTGYGTLTLTGANTYTGGTAVNGSLRATQPLPGDVTVSNFGELDAVPRIAGNLSNASRLIVQDGDTTVGGNYTQLSGGTDHGTLAVSLGSKLAVAGTATLSGTLEVTGIDSGYSYNTHTDVLTAAGGISGTFDNLVVDSGTAFTDETIHYGANDVYLDTTGLSITVAAKAMGIVEPAAVSAAQRVQDGFETIDATTASAGTVPSDVLQGAGDIQHSATPAVAHATLTSLSGQLHAASAAMLFDGIDARSDALAGHFDDLLSGRAASGIWYGNLDWQGNLQRSGYAGATFRSDGGMAGADMRFGGHALLGVAVGQSRGFGQLDAAWDHDRTWMSNIAAYGSLMNGPWYASAQVAGGWYREDMQRLLQLGALGAPVGARSTGHYVAGSLEGGRLFHVGGTRVVPFANVRYQRLALGGFTEQGGLGYGLKTNAHGTGRLQAGLGLRAAHGWRLADGMRMEFDGSVGWRHTLHEYGSAFDASFTGFNDWLPVEGIGLSRNTAILRAGLSLWPTRNVGLRIGYMREQDQRERAGSAMLQGSVTF